jgi:hypothetical protein
MIFANPAVAPGPFNQQQWRRGCLMEFNYAQPTVESAAAWLPAKNELLQVLI